MGFSGLAGAQCWRWGKKSIPGAPALADAEGLSRITFNESTQKLTVAVYWGGPDDIVDLWTYDGVAWELVWSDNPISGLVGVDGLYFDQNLNSLVMFGTYSIWFEQSACAFFKFVPNQGWARIAQDYPFTVCPPGVGYDSYRKRAVMATSWDYNYYPPKPLTLEFDGSNFYYFYMQEELNLIYCPFGYDPTTGKILYYGRWSSEDPAAATFEYLNAAWTRVGTGHSPELGWARMMGMVYVPDFGGIAGIPESYSDGELWVYKNNDWHRIIIQNTLPGRYYGAMGFDRHRNKVVVQGGLNDDIPSHDTWELMEGQHCRPITKP